MMKWIKSLFTCTHDHATFPLTKNKRTYIVCLDCGAEADYDWSSMRVK